MTVSAGRPSSSSSRDCSWRWTRRCPGSTPSPTTSRLIAQQGEEFEVLGGIGDQIADIGDELYAASDRDKLREWGNEIDTPEGAGGRKARLTPRAASARDDQTVGMVSLGCPRTSSTAR